MDRSRIVRDVLKGEVRVLTVQGRARRWTIRVTPAKDMNFRVNGYKVHLGWRSGAMGENEAVDEALRVIVGLIEART